MTTWKVPCNDDMESAMKVPCHTVSIYTTVPLCKFFVLLALLDVSSQIFILFFKIMTRVKLSTAQRACLQRAANFQKSRADGSGGDAKGTRTGRVITNAVSYNRISLNYLLLLKMNSIF